MDENDTSTPTAMGRSFRELPSRHLALVGFEVGLALLINIAALVGNVLVCYVLYKNPRLRTVTNYPIVSLAVSDMSFALVCLPFSIGVLIEGRWIFGKFVCAIQAYFANCLAFVTVITLSFTAANRYCKVARSVAFYRRHFTKRKTIGCIVAIWLVVFGTMSVPLAAKWASTGFSTRMALCIMIYKRELVSLISMMAIILAFLAVPWIVALVCYGCLYIAVRRHRKAVNFGNSSRLTAEDVNVNRTLLTVMIGFSICWLPMLVITILHVVNVGDTSLRYVNMIYSYMGALSSAINPVIYGFMNKAFRKEYRKLLRLSRSDESQTTSSHRTNQRKAAWKVERKCF